MDYTMIFIVLSILTWYYFLIKEKYGRVSARLPPGPYPLPIIGSILKLGNKPHHSLAALSKTYGPLMSLKLGSTTTIVVSSREIAQELFSKHDISASSNRSIPYVTRAHDHHKFSLPFLPVGDKWRRLRRISQENVFSVRQLDASQLLRKEKVQQLVDYVHGCCLAGKPVNIGVTISTTTLNLLSNFIFSTDLAEYDSLSSQNFKGFVWSVLEAVGTPNLADFFPVLAPLDPHGLFRRTSLYVGKLLAIFEQHINKRLEATTSSSSKDLMDLLLDISRVEESAIGLDDIRHFFFDLYVAGTDTTSSTLEWAMAELIKNREKMSKARSELEEVIRNEDRLVDESDISRLPYLQAIIKETLRLHPPVTFLLPRKAISDIEIQGYVIPKDAQILCNLWAMGQDPNVWSDPQTFQPERFLEVGIDYKGHDFELIPFGSGRRICPGLPLAHRMLHLMLGCLIYRFDWKIEEGQDVDMSDKLGLTLQKNLPLMAIPVKV